MSADTGGASSRSAAFFDVDGTLCDTTIAHHYSYFMLRRRPGWRGRVWFVTFLAKCGYYLLIDRVDRLRFNVVFYRNYAGLPSAEIKAQAEDCYRRVIAPRRFPDAEECVAEHHAAGRRIVFVTGSLDFVIAPLARELRASDVLASRLAEADGRFTGELAGAPIGAEEKARLVREYAETHDVDLGQSFAYGDSMADVPMLEAVGFPHAVNPGRKLASRAAARGWPVHRWARAGDANA